MKITNKLTLSFDTATSQDFTSHLKCFIPYYEIDDTKAESSISVTLAD